MKIILFLTLLIIYSFGQDGKCGDNCYFYVINETLIINGTEKMNDYDDFNHFYNYHDKITTIIIEEGITSIGNYVFESFYRLTNVEISNSVKIIGENSFEFCEMLKNIKFGNSIEIIKKSAFKYCRNLKIINLPNSLITIEDYAFFLIVKI